MMRLIFLFTLFLLSCSHSPGVHRHYIISQQQEAEELVDIQAQQEED